MEREVAAVVEVASLTLAVPHLGGQRFETTSRGSRGERTRRQRTAKVEAQSRPFHPAPSRGGPLVVEAEAMYMGTGSSEQPFPTRCGLLF